MRFLVGIVTLGKNKHAHCFMDFAKAMAAALRSLGHECEYANPGVRPGRLIMFGANNIVEDKANPQIPPDSIIFNAEQVSAIADPTYFLQSWVQLRNFSVWDYAESNVDTLKKLGIYSAVLCPVGYHKSMEVIKPAEEDIDILFYGSAGGPRREILDALDKTGLNVVRLFGVYGAERDAFIARSKVVINLHYYPNGVFEIFRCSHLFANRKCVVNEAGGRDRGLEELAKRCTAYTLRDQFVERCRELVASPHKRAIIADQAYEEFKKVDLIEGVRKALEES